MITVADWKRWLHLTSTATASVQTFLAAPSPEYDDIPVERLAATPEELARVAGIDAAFASAVVDAFVECIRLEIKPGQVFFDYCPGYALGIWTNTPRIKSHECREHEGYARHVLFGLS